MSLLRRIYQLLSVLAVLHLVGLAGLAGALWMQGTLSVERVEKLAAVLRGEFDGEASAVGVSEATVADVSTEGVAGAETSGELGRFKSERARSELDQQLALVTREMIRVREERDRFEAQRARELEAAKKKLEQTRQAGYQKQLQYLESLKPALALELLLGREDEEAAGILKSMDTRKGRKILEAARTPLQKKRMDGIMRLLPETNAVPVPAEPAGDPSKATP